MHDLLGKHNVYKLCKKEPKIRFLAILSNFGHWIDFKMQISIILNDLDKWAVISPFYCLFE